MSIKCVTLTLLPFEKSGWHQDSCSTDSYQSALLPSILALEGNVKKYFYIKAFFCFIENQVFLLVTCMDECRVVSL